MTVYDVLLTETELYLLKILFINLLIFNATKHWKNPFQIILSSYICSQVINRWVSILMRSRTGGIKRCSKTLVNPIHWSIIYRKTTRFGITFFLTFKCLGNGYLDSHGKCTFITLVVYLFIEYMNTIHLNVWTRPTVNFEIRLL